MDQKVYPVILREGEDGKYIAECPALEGCITQGDTIQEALDNVREAIALCLEVLRERGEPAPEPGTTLLSEVAVPV